MTDDDLGSHRQPTHYALGTAIAALSAKVDAKFDNLDKRLDAGDVMRAQMVQQLNDIGTRTAVLESHEDVTKAKSDPKMPRWAIAAAAVAILGGLASAVETVGDVAVAVWVALVHK